MSKEKTNKHFGAAIIKDVLSMKKEGKSNKEISEFYGFKNKTVIKNLVKRYNLKQAQTNNTICSIYPNKNIDYTFDKTRDDEIKRLTMENDLLRTFLQITGRL